jgi:hypothetical protein
MPEKHRELPADPVSFIQRCVQGGKVLWTYHVNMRMGTRAIDRNMILASFESYEIVEAYPMDKYLPSYLVLADYKGARFHVLFAVDTAGDSVRVLTTYRPSPLEWHSDLRTRRKRQ